MKVFLAAVIFIGLCVLGLGVSIFFRRNGHFPETDISRNKDMKRLGITCVKEEELRLHGGRFRNRSGMTGEGGRPDACTGEYTDACAGCAFFEKKENVERRD